MKSPLRRALGALTQALRETASGIVTTPRGRVFIAITGVIVVFDQWSKYWAVGALTRAFDAAHTLSFGERLGRFWSFRHHSPKNPVEIISDYWHFRYIENPGGAFGLFSNFPDWFRTPFFLTASVVAMVFIVRFIHTSKPHQWIARISFGLVFGGAIGNFVDRIRLGYVIDFIDWHVKDAHWPTFNIADSAISVGVVLLLLEGYLVKAPDENGKVVAA